MKAAVYYETGPPSVLRYEEVADPVPGPGEILVDIEAISIEGGDTLSRLRGTPAQVPHIVGYQAAGRIAQLGEDVTAFAVGDRVVTIGVDGSHAEKRVVGTTVAWKVPYVLPIEVAACVPIAFGTAHDCLFEFGHLSPGETVLIQAGAGGVGLAAIQIASRIGARVLATASNDGRLERLREFGLDEGINYVTHDFVSEARRLTGGAGVDLVVDSVGGSTLRGSLQALAYRGRCITVGEAGRSAAEPLDISGIRPNSQTLCGYFLGAELFAGDRAYRMVAEQLDLVAGGQLRVVIDRSFPLSEAAEAHAYIESRQAFGRVILFP